MIFMKAQGTYEFATVVMLYFMSMLIITNVLEKGFEQALFLKTTRKNAVSFGIESSVASALADLNQKGTTYTQNYKNYRLLFDNATISVTEPFYNTTVSIRRHRSTAVTDEITSVGVVNAWAISRN